MIDPWSEKLFSIASEVFLKRDKKFKVDFDYVEKCLN